MNTEFENIFFDFDGTICDTAPGVFNSFDKVVEWYGLDIDRSIYKKMIGPPLKESFSKFFHLPESEIQNAIKKYREYYSVNGLFECDVYPGVEQLFKDLRSAGKKLFVATSKPELFTKQILERKNLIHYFDLVGGSDMEEKLRVEKVDVVRYVLSQCGSGPEKCLMIGDRFYDVKGAHLCDIKCCGIEWGFGNSAEFEECGADYICSTPSDVYDLICKKS